MTICFLFQVIALPLMHFFLFNPNPFTATFAFMAKGAKEAQPNIFLCSFSNSSAVSATNC